MTSGERREFEGRCVLVTGGGTGLGLAAAQRFAARGARLVLASRSAEHLEPAAGDLPTREAPLE